MSGFKSSGPVEYKTVAMPQEIRGRRKRRQSRAEMIAETVAGVINQEAQQGWHYVGTDTFTCWERPFFLARKEMITYTVMIFSRPAKAVGETKTLAAGDPSATPLIRSVKAERTDPISDEIDERAKAAQMISRMAAKFSTKG
ncbi:MAG: hypothetical protein MRY63_11030 [Neomegalonema sp.]|nr:hypothetical protein [Neomegalonema sp.]